MFISRTPACFRKCSVWQQYGMLIGSRLIAEPTSIQYHQIPKASIHTSCIRYGRTNLLKKFANKSKKKLWYENPTFGPKQISPSGQTDPLQPIKPKKINHEGSFRTRILNTILFKAINDFISSYEVSAEICNLNVEISKVSLPPDFSNCRVYWKTSGTSERDSLIQQVLDKSAPRIRHLLISHQILRSVPHLVFIRDKQYAAVTEVENLLKMADFGPEENTEEAKNNDSIKFGGESAHFANSSEQPVTAKPGVFFGLDHEGLKKQVLEYKQRSKEAPQETPVLSLTQQQLDQLAEMRKQKHIKKKNKSKRPVDNDITPEAYLLAKYSERIDVDELEVQEYDEEESQVREQLEKEDHRS
ncbi:hypothetical protein AGOR_G00206910 [Albula goreensis]|uniref:Ribosome-binding factor A, mitochondrial n=1 Tax=Albula goreensis TaxID=1534307 RepID=A0A8T3CKQ7_9TELE|nr:hypothetical protein AGOR_G00206910 [Albula goreensis]